MLKHCARGNLSDMQTPENWGRADLSDPTKMPKISQTQHKQVRRVNLQAYKELPTERPSPRCHRLGTFNKVQVQRLTQSTTVCSAQSSEGSTSVNAGAHMTETITSCI